MLMYYFVFSIAAAAVAAKHRPDKQLEKKTVYV